MPLQISQALAPHRELDLSDHLEGVQKAAAPRPSLKRMIFVESALLALNRRLASRRAP